MKVKAVNLSIPVFRLNHPGPTETATKTSEDTDSYNIAETDKSNSNEEEGDSLHLSLNAELASNRYIDADERLLGDTATSMYDFVPTSRLKGMEDFVEESEYYQHYQKGR